MKPIEGILIDIAGTAILDDRPLPGVGEAMVGDDIEGDVGGALNADMQGVLVKTGNYDEKWVRKSKVVPTALIDSLADLPDWLGL